MTDTERRSLADPDDDVARLRARRDELRRRPFESLIHWGTDGVELGHWERIGEFLILEIVYRGGPLELRAWREGEPHDRLLRILANATFHRVDEFADHARAALRPREAVCPPSCRPLGVEVHDDHRTFITTSSRFLPRRGEPVTLRAAIAELAAMARQLAPAHAAGVAHGGISSSALRGADAPILCDWEVSPWSTGFRLFMLPEAGPAGYRDPRPMFAPEEMRGGPLAPPVDIFRLGVLLYGRLTGDSPFQDAREGISMQSEWWRAVAAGELIELIDPAPSCEELCAWVRRCLQRDPGARPAAEDLADALDALAAGLPSELRVGEGARRGARVIAQESRLQRLWSRLRGRG